MIPAASAVAKTVPTVDELIAVLKKTALPTIICEGTSDIVVYRRFEQKIGELDVSVLAAGGRRNVLELFNRRAEFSEGAKTAYLVDRDVYVYTEIPTEYSSPNVIFTDGYSIENDVISDGELEGILYGDDAARYQSELVLFVNWYALALSRHLRNPEVSISTHPNEVLADDRRDVVTRLVDGEEYPCLLEKRVFEDYRRLLRGKSLLDLLIRNISARKGHGRVDSRIFLESVAIRPGEKINAMSRAVASVFRS